MIEYGEFKQKPPVKEESIGTTDSNASVNTLNFRPSELESYVGQKQIVEQIKISIKAAKEQNRVLDHTLLFGPPGLGKTSLASLIAAKMDVNIRLANASLMHKKGDIISLLLNLKAQDILFIDEIHRLPTPIEEILYSAMEDYRVDILSGSKKLTKTISLNLEPFTLIGATTKIGSISQPMRDRFGIHHRLEYYLDDEIGVILNQSATLLNITLTELAVNTLINCSRGTPRIANRILRRVSDYAYSKNTQIIEDTIVQEALKGLKINELGLEVIDIKILDTIKTLFKGGPVGLSSIAAVLSEDEKTITDTIEPYLIRQGLINRTHRGRIITKKGEVLLQKTKIKEPLSLT